MLAEEPGFFEITRPRSNLPASNTEPDGQGASTPASDALSRPVAANERIASARVSSTGRHCRSSARQVASLSYGRPRVAMLIDS